MFNYLVTGHNVNNLLYAEDIFIIENEFKLEEIIHTVYKCNDKLVRNLMEAA